MSIRRSVNMRARRRGIRLEIATTIVSPRCASRSLIAVGHAIVEIWRIGCENILTSGLIVATNHVVAPCIGLDNLSVNCGTGVACLGWQARRYWEIRNSSEDGRRGSVQGRGVNISSVGERRGNSSGRSRSNNERRLACD
jgi:hypothetical protein